MSTAQAIVFLFVTLCALGAGLGLHLLAAPIRAAHDPDRGPMSRGVTAAFFGGPVLALVGLGMLIVLGSFVTR